MKKIKLLFFGLIFSYSLNAAEPYTSANESLPKVGEETTVYLGDVMFQQRVGFYQECLRANKSFEKKCCLGGLLQIEEGGLLCKSDKESNLYHPNFPSFVHSSKGPREEALSIYPKGKKIRIQFVSQTITDLTPQEFEEAFSPDTSGTPISQVFAGIQK